MAKLTNRQISAIAQKVRGSLKAAFDIKQEELRSDKAFKEWKIKNKEIVNLLDTVVQNAKKLISKLEDINYDVRRAGEIDLKEILWGLFAKETRILSEIPSLSTIENDIVLETVGDFDIDLLVEKLILRYS